MGAIYAYLRGLDYMKRGYERFQLFKLIFNKERVKQLQVEDLRRKVA